MFSVPLNTDRILMQDMHRLTCEHHGLPHDFDALATLQQRLPHGAPATVQLLAYAAGALPSAHARPHSRRSSNPRSSAPHSLQPLMPEVQRALNCAVCRVAVQELSIVGEYVGRCATSLDDDGRERWVELLGRTPSVLCEHLEALGQLGHTAHRLRTLGSRAVCDAAITSNARALSRELLGGADEDTLRATACSSTCDADEGGLRGELRHWPAALQLLLDQDDALLSVSLASEDNLLVAEGSGASSALLLLAATRSDGLVIRALCALGVCERALAEAPSAEALASVLALAAFEGSGGSKDVDALPVTLSALTDAALRLVRMHWDAPRTRDLRAVARSSPSAAGASAPHSSPYRQESPTSCGEGPTGADTRAVSGAISALHVASFLLDADGLAVMLRRTPPSRLVAGARAGAVVADGRGRQPLHYVAHGAERHRLLVYLFNPQPFRTWLTAHSRSQLGFAPPLTRRNLTVELADAHAAAVSILTHHGATTSATDALGQTPIHVAAASGASVELLTQLAAAATPAATPAATAAGATAEATGRAQTLAAMHKALQQQLDLASSGLASLLAQLDATGRSGAELADAAGLPLPSHLAALVPAPQISPPSGPDLADLADLARSRQISPPSGPDASSSQGGVEGAREGADGARDMAPNPEVSEELLGDTRSTERCELDGDPRRSTARCELDVLGDPRRSTERCELDVLDAHELSAAKLEARYLRRGRPFIMRNVTADWPAHLSLGHDAFHATFATVAWEPQLLLPGEKTLLGPYLRRAAAGQIRRPIAFNRPSDPGALHVMQQEVRWPLALRGHSKLWRARGSTAVSSAKDDERYDEGSSSRGARAGLDFFVGPNASGTPMHHHSAVWNALIYGRKLWALMPPARATFGKVARQHPLDSDWYKVWLGRGAAGRTKADAKGGTKRAGGRAAAQRYIFCEQEAESLVYLPSSWAHATLNLEEGVAVGGFLHDEGSLGLHMQLLHAPRGMGSLQNAATLHSGWYQNVAPAFPERGA